MSRDRKSGSTRDGVEFDLATIGIGIRGFDLVQAGFSVISGSLTAYRAPELGIGALCLITAESALLGIWLFRRRSVIPFGWPNIVDFGFSVAALGSAIYFTDAAQRLNVWTMWPYPVTLSTAVILGGACRRLHNALLFAGGLATVYLAVVAFPLVGHPSDVATALANSAAYVGFALVAFFFARFVRRLADTADDALARVAELERGLSKARVHALLLYLNPDHLTDADELTRGHFEQQRRAKFEEMRAYVDGNPAPRDLETLVRRVVGGHRILTPRIVIDLDQGVVLPQEVTERLERAMDTALANVEQHASGANVVVAASADSRTVTVTVLDSGPGFSTPLHRPGFGMKEILGRHLEDVGGRATVTPSPGKGTVVEIIVPREVA